MSRQANPTLIGGFVVGAVALAIAGILIFGSGKLFTKEFDYVMFFEGSVSGLSAGAPVEFRGVKIGSVTDIVMTVDRKELELRIPVFIELVSGTVRNVGEWGPSEDPRKTIEELVRRGLRGQMQTQSLVTGQQYIELDIYPDAPPAEVTIDEDTGLPEIPTVPTTLQEFAQTARNVIAKIEKLPIGEIFDNLNSALAGVDRLVNSPEAGEAVRSLNAALKQLEDTLSIAGEDSAIRYELTDALAELSAAARSIRLLADYLERHPEALIAGKAGPGGS